MNLTVYLTLFDSGEDRNMASATFAPLSAMGQVRNSGSAMKRPSSNLFLARYVLNGVSWGYSLRLK